MALVALRVVIGWHFFLEGLSHKNDPKWSSEGFLRQAKGPLAEFYKSKAPGFHRWHELLLTPLVDDPIAQQAAKKTDVAKAEEEDDGIPKGERSTVFGEWYRQVAGDWNHHLRETANFYGFSDEQKKSLGEIRDQYDRQLRVTLYRYEPDILFFRKQLSRTAEFAAAPGSDDVPFLQGRLTKRQGNPVGEPGSVSQTTESSPSDWLGDVQALEAAQERDVLSLLTEDQKELGSEPAKLTDLQKMDKAVTWLLIIGGGCLMAGLFTRLSALALALFLASIIISQPPWIAGAVPTYFHAVELVALLTLTTSHVGRWGGLDFFVHYVLLRPFRSA